MSKSNIRSLHWLRMNAKSDDISILAAHLLELKEDIEEIKVILKLINTKREGE